MDNEIDTKVNHKSVFNKSKHRWNMLRNAVLKKKLGKDDLTISVRSFTSYGLFSMKKPDNTVESKTYRDEDKGFWVAYSCKDIIQSETVWIQHSNTKTDLKELAGFDNTGNVCIWPSEEVLAYYCTLHSSSFDGKSVIELGGGNSCLGGLCIAIHSKPKSMVLTDGNKKCIDSIEKTVKRNLKNLEKRNISVVQLRWDDPDTYDDFIEKLDYVICADCLFFDQTRESLAKAIYNLLKPSGIALIFAPRRGNTLAQFVDICHDHFAVVNLYDNYCCRISNCHKRELNRNKYYQADLHFPLLIELMK